MLFKVDTAGKIAAEIPHATLSQLQLRERYDLQEWILATPRILGEDLLVITSEFSGFDRTAERLDVLAIDKQGVLTIVELKRSAVGTAAELQALRYAAYCSTMSFRDLTELLAAYQSRRNGESFAASDAERAIRAFVDEPEFTAVTDKPRIILGAEEFSAEITATVMWLRSFGVDISCVRLRPYQIDGQLLLESSVLIPLPEAREYQIRREIKDAEQPSAQSREVTEPEDFLATVPEEVRPMLTQLRLWLLEHTDIGEEAYKTLLSYRRRSDRDWVTWLQFTRWEARAAIRPEVEIDPRLFVRNTSGGWSIVRARTIEEVEQVKALLNSSMQYHGPLRTT
jgi:hypothetical protein